MKLSALTQESRAPGRPKSIASHHTFLPRLSIRASVVSDKTGLKKRRITHPVSVWRLRFQRETFCSTLMHYVDRYQLWRGRNLGVAVTAGESSDPSKYRKCVGVLCGNVGLRKKG